MNVSVGYLLVVTVEDGTEGSCFENRLADYMYFNVSGPLVLSFSIDNVLLHKFYIAEGFDTLGFIGAIRPELYKYEFANEISVSECDLNIQLTFVRFPGKQIDICHRYPIPYTCDSEYTIESLLESLKKKAY